MCNRACDKVRNMDEKKGPIYYETKLCRIEIAPRALLMAAAVMLSVLLISIMISQYNSAREVVNSSSDIMSRKAEEIRDSDIMQYDGLTVNGEDVINFMKKNLGEDSELYGQLKVTLKGVSGNTMSYSDTEPLSSLTDPENEKYVRPFSKWKCSVKKNKNGIITEVVFSKKQ